MKQFSKDLGNVSLAPKGKWSKEQEYERLALVYNACDNLSYVSKIDVPIGVEIDNREYWQPMNATGYSDNNFINLTAENENGTITAYESLEEAVATIVPVNRRAGATLSFYNLNADRLDRQAEFELWQFNSTDLANWENKDYWNNIYYNWNVFAGWYVGADALKNHVKIPNVGQYAYVGSNLNDAILYQCRTNGSWTNTGIKVRNYISVVVSGNITIGDNGNWFSNGEDTGIPATPAVDEQLDNIITKHESLSRTVQGIAATGGASTATNVTYNNNTSGLNAENAQDAIDELQNSKIDKTSILQESGEAEDKIMSQGAVKTELGKKANTTDVDTKFTEEKNRVDGELGKKFDKGNIVQTTGESEDKVISQKATTIAIADETTRAKAAEKTNEETITNEVARLDKKIDTQKNEINAAKEDALQAIAENEQSVITNFNAQRVTPEMLSESTKQLIETSGGGTITNLADDEDLTSVDDGTGSTVLKFADKAYNPDNFSGKGYKILRKNITLVSLAVTKIIVSSVPTSDGATVFTINGVEVSIDMVTTTMTSTDLVAQKIAEKLTETMTEYEVSIDASLITLTRKFSGSVTPSVFSASTTGVVCTITDSTKKEFRNILTQDMINQPNTIYEIRYDYDLDDRKIILNEEISLCLVGGDIKNGKIVCNNTWIYGKGRLSCELNGKYFYEGKADGVDLIETNKGISFKDNITYNLENNERNKVFLRAPISYKSLMYPKEIIDKYSLTGNDRFMINTDYLLLDNIDLGGKDSSHWIRFGKGCSLTNLGGSIYNGYVVFTDLKIIGKYPFRDLTDNSSVENEISIDVNSNIDLSKLINTKLQQYKYILTIRLGVGKYELSAPITIPKNKKLIIIGSGKDRSAFNKKQDYNNYNPTGSFLVFNNIDKKCENISVFSGEGVLDIKNTSLYLLEDDVSYTLNDNPKPSDFNTLVLGNSNISGISTNGLAINNCSLFCFTNAGIIIKQPFQMIENVDVMYCRTGIKAEIKSTGDEQFLNLYIRYCEIGMELNGGHINITKLWIDEITKYAILLNEINNRSSIRIVDLHINHCNYSGIKATSFERAMIVGTINRCGCYYAGFDIKDVPEIDLDKCCGIYVNSCTNSTFIFNSSYQKIDDPGVISNYGQVSSPVIDIIANNFSNNNVFLNSNFKKKIYKSNSQKTYALCKIKTQYNNNSIINNGVECNISSDKYIIETPKIGNSNNRPNLDNNSAGFDYYDINLKKKILWEGTKWVNLDGTELS